MVLFISFMHIYMKMFSHYFLCCIAVKTIFIETFLRSTHELTVFFLKDQISSATSRGRNPWDINTGKRAGLTGGRVQNLSTVWTEAAVRSRVRLIHRFVAIHCRFRGRFLLAGSRSRSTRVFRAPVSVLNAQNAVDGERQALLAPVHGSPSHLDLVLSQNAIGFRGEHIHIEPDRSPLCVKPPFTK